MPNSLLVRNILETLPDDEQMHLIQWRMYTPAPDVHINGNEACVPRHIEYYIDIFQKYDKPSICKTVVTKNNYLNGAKLVMGNHVFSKYDSFSYIKTLAYAHFAARSSLHLKKKTIFLYLNIIADIEVSEPIVASKRDDFLTVINDISDPFSYTDNIFNKFNIIDRKLVFHPIYQSANDIPPIKFFGRKPLSLPMLESECKKLIDGLMNDLRDRQDQLKTISDPDLMNDIVSLCGIIRKRITLLIEARNYLYKFVE